VVGLYSTLGEGYPGSRYSQSLSIFSNNTIVLYAGYGYSTSTSAGYLNDMWIFNTYYESCTCFNGECDPLNGTCTCNLNYFGLTCNSSCSCINGDCDSTNGSCKCFPQFTGVQCDQRCINSDCTTTCVCNDATLCQIQNLCNDNNETFSNSNNISIDSTNATITFINLNIYYSFILAIGNINILGNLTSSGSYINATDSQYFVKGDLSLSNVSILFSNSSLIVDGCIYLNNNTQINVDLSPYIKYKQNTITLMTSKNDCLMKEVTLTIIYSNKGPCDEVQQQEDTDTLSLILHFSTCSSSISQHIKMILFILFSIFE